MNLIKEAKETPAIELLKKYAETGYCPIKIEEFHDYKGADKMELLNMLNNNKKVAKSRNNVNTIALTISKPLKNLKLGEYVIKTFMKHMVNMVSTV